jgi:hypothetical protein
MSLSAVGICLASAPMITQIATRSSRLCRLRIDGNGDARRRKKRKVSRTSSKVQGCSQPQIHAHHSRAPCFAHSTPNRGRLFSSPLCVAEKLASTQWEELSDGLHVLAECPRHSNFHFKSTNRVTLKTCEVKRAGLWRRVNETNRPRNLKLKFSLAPRLSLDFLSSSRTRFLHGHWRCRRRVAHALRQSDG